MRTIVIINVILLFSTGFAYSQSTIKPVIGLGVLAGIGNNSPIDESFNAFSLSAGILLPVNEHISTGLIIGTDNHRSTGKIVPAHFNTLPIRATLGWYAKPDNAGLFLDSHVGYAVKLFNDFNKGLNLGVDTGYSWHLGKNSFNLRTGYNFQQIAQGNISSNLNLQSVRVAAGLIF